jgi:hypothetical protein
MKVVCILKHIKRRNVGRNKGEQGEECMVGQKGSFDSPGKRKP